MNSKKCLNQQKNNFDYFCLIHKIQRTILSPLEEVKPFKQDEDMTRNWLSSKIMFSADWYGSAKNCKIATSPQLSNTWFCKQCINSISQNWQFWPRICASLPKNNPSQILKNLLDQFHPISQSVILFSVNTDLTVVGCFL